MLNTAAHSRDNCIVLFDWDGTLADNFSVIRDGLNYVHEHFSMPIWSDEEARQNIRLTARDLYSKTFDSDEDVEKAIKLYLAYVDAKHLELIEPIKGSIEFVKKLKSVGFRLGIVSNKTQRFLDKEVKQLGLEDQFDAVIGAGTAARDKPHPDSILYAIDKLNLEAEPDKVFYVGDTDTDMLAARRAGADGVFVTYGLGRVEDLKKTVFVDNFPKICNDYEELYELLVNEKK